MREWVERELRGYIPEDEARIILEILVSDMNSDRKKFGVIGFFAGCVVTMLLLNWLA